MSDETKNGQDASVDGKKIETTSGPAGEPAKDFSASGAPTTAPVTEAPTKESQPKKSKTPLIIGIVVLAVAVVIGVCVWMFVGQGGFYDNAAQNGQAPYKTEEEMQAELNRVVEDGMLNISIASVITFKNGTSEGTAYIENVPSNKYVMKVTITLDSNNETVYESGGIKPDSHIDNIKLTKSLPAGTYPATATFTAYDPESLDEVGQAAAKVTIVVEE